MQSHCLAMIRLAQSQRDCTVFATIKSRSRRLKRYSVYSHRISNHPKIAVCQCVVTPTDMSIKDTFYCWRAVGLLTQ